MARSTTLLLAGLLATALSGAVSAREATATDAAGKAQRLPWAAQGLTERQAAAHLLDRFAFGARPAGPDGPGDVDRVVAQGLEAWLEAQLGAAIDDSRFEQRSKSLDAWRMPADELTRTFPPYNVLRREAMRAGLIDRGTVPPAPGDPVGKGKASGQREAVLELYRDRGFRPERELIGQLMAHKLLQAVYSENQLEAVLVDFWFNHFNVSLTDNQARLHLLSFERDAITPGVLGKFGDLLAEVASHPAMLLYLDNAQSTANPGVNTTLTRRPGMDGGGRRYGMDDDGGMPGAMRDGMRRPGAPARPGAQPPPPAQTNRPRGLNENYARELLELHTLGVDGGYTQDDVIAVARAFTGWTVLPPAGFGDQARDSKNRDRRRRAGGLGIVERDSGFFFRPDAHDAEAKTVLGKKLPAGRGIEDGRDVLALVAQHPATARHLATKLAVRFVADEPPPALIDRLAQTYQTSGGDLRAVTRALAYSPEFWSREARTSKIKSPFEVAVSAVRALGADVTTTPRLSPLMDIQRQRRQGPPGLLEWVNRMGQPLYAYQAPTGFPDRAEAWVSTGSLLTRMNFGLHLASGRIVGVAIDLDALNGGREPESPEHALATYAALMLPERDLAATVKRLAPLVRDPEVGARVARAAADVKVPTAGGGAMAAEDEATSMDRDDSDADEEIDPARVAPPMSPTESAVDTVVGLILGSPEFQRR